jgi:hypothetical protein
MLASVLQWRHSGVAYETHQRQAWRKAEEREEKRMRQYILNEIGEPQECTDILEWGMWMQGPQRVVAKDEINGVRISTVFLGIDHRFGFGEPILFETMIFGGAQDQYQERYCTKAEAIAGHAQAVALVAGGAPTESSS